MERATEDEVRHLLQRPCPVCHEDKYYYLCHGAEEGKVIGEKMCPIHAASLLKDCCVADPAGHKM